MEYRSIYDSVDAVRYTGYNFKEVNDFTDGKLVWNSKELEWSENNPPKDLQVILRGDAPQRLKAGDYVVRLSSNKYIKFDEFDFENLFEGAEE